MAKLLSTMLRLTYTTLLLSCGGNKENEAQPETPKALQEELSEIKMYSRASPDLTEDLYSELVEKSPELKNLEDDLAVFGSKPEALLTVFEKYNSKSQEYYRSAEAKVTTIQDSLMRKRILTLLATSKKQYGNKTGELEALISQISKNGNGIQDYHTVLKIVLTMSVMEKYQNENMPDKIPFQKLTKEQEKLRLQIDGLTPKF